MICKHCGTELDRDNAGRLVDAVSGDAGGTFDYCPDNPTGDEDERLHAPLVGQHGPGADPARRVDLVEMPLPPEMPAEDEGCVTCEQQAKMDSRDADRCCPACEAAAKRPGEDE